MNVLSHIAGVDGQFVIDVHQFIHGHHILRPRLSEIGRHVFTEELIICAYESHWFNGWDVANPRKHLEGADWICNFRLANVMLGGKGCVCIGLTYYAILDYKLDNEAGWNRDMAHVEMIGLEREPA